MTMNLLAVLLGLLIIGVSLKLYSINMSSWRLYGATEIDRNVILLLLSFGCLLVAYGLGLQNLPTVLADYLPYFG